MRSVTKGAIRFQKEFVLRDQLYDLIKMAIEKKDFSIIQERGLHDLAEFIWCEIGENLSDVRVYKEFTIPYYGKCDVVVVKNLFDINGAPTDGCEQYLCVYAIEVKNNPIKCNDYNQICRYLDGLVESGIFNEVKGCVIGTGFHESHYLFNFIQHFEGEGCYALPRTAIVDYKLDGIHYIEQSNKWYPSRLIKDENSHEIIKKHYADNGVIKTLTDSDKDFINKKLQDENIIF